MVGGGSYYYHGGVFFASGPSGYVVVGAPRGAVVRVLPVGHTVVYVHGIRYHYYCGTYYTYVPQQEHYVVVEAPKDAVVVELPDGATSIKIDGKTYFKYDEVLYKPVFVDGEIAYKVIEL